MRELAGRMRQPEQPSPISAPARRNLTGERRLLELAERHGLAELRAGMDEILDYAERRTRAALARRPTAPTRQPSLEGKDGDIELRCAPS